MPVLTVKARAGHPAKTVDLLMARLRKITARTLRCPIEHVWVLYEELAPGCTIYGDFARSNPKKRK